MINELLRKEIETCGKTRNRISLESGVSPAQLCRFVQGKTLTVPVCEKLLKYFGYAIKKGGKNEAL